MVGVSDQERAYIADITQRFSSLGVDGSHLTIEYQNELQDYHVLLADVAISDDQIEGIIDSVAPIVHVEFASAETYQRYAAAYLRRLPSIGPGIIGGT
jgi:hypothetical protein